jgi:hypothetical protein
VFRNFKTPTNRDSAAARHSASNMKLKYRLPFIIVLACLVVNTLRAQSTVSTPANPPLAITMATTTNLPTTNTIVLPQPLRDPIEPFNRAVWSFNEGLMISVIKPVSTGYRFVVPKPVRKGIGNAGRKQDRTLKNESKIYD